MAARTLLCSLATFTLGHSSSHAPHTHVKCLFATATHACNRAVSSRGGALLLVHDLAARSRKLSSDRMPRSAQSARQLLPPAIHAELPEAGLGAGRLLIIGDVHGCLEELRALLLRLRFQQGNDTVVLVGDLVGKGPDSLGVRAARALCMRPCGACLPEACVATCPLWLGPARIPAPPKLLRVGGEGKACA